MYISIANASGRVAVDLGSAISGLQIDVVQHDVSTGHAVATSKLHCLLTLWSSSDVPVNYFTYFHCRCLSDRKKQCVIMYTIRFVFVIEICSLGSQVYLVLASCWRVAIKLVNDNGVRDIFHHHVLETYCTDITRPSLPDWHKVTDFMLDKNIVETSVFFCLISTLTQCLNGLSFWCKSFSYHAKTKSWRQFLTNENYREMEYKLYRIKE